MVNKNLKVQNKLNLKNDIIFKTFFSRKGNEEFLIDFLKALLKIEIKSITIQEEVNLEKLATQEKGGRLDLQAELNNGIIVNIELQIKNKHNIEERTTFYSSKVVSRNLQRGKDYKEIKQVIMINILDYEMLGFDEYISKTVIVLDKHREYEVLKGIKWYFIELPKFRKINPNMNEKINQWLAFIDDYDRGKVEVAEKKNKTIEKARIEMNYLTGDAEVQRLAELREKWDMDYTSGINHARKEGEAKGIIKGKAEGKAEGIKDGELNKQKQIATEMLKKKMSIELISEITKLSKEEIENLMKK